VDNVTREYFEKTEMEYVRLGKKTETGHPYYIPVLMDFLRLCKEFDTKIIMPTKALPFNYASVAFLPIPSDMKDFVPAGNVLVDLFKEVGGVINYSITWDCLEKGMVDQGFTNRWRVEPSEFDCALWARYSSYNKGSRQLDLFD